MVVYFNIGRAFKQIHSLVEFKKIFKSPPNAECHFSSLHLLQNVAQAILIEQPNIILAIYIIGKKK